MMASSVLIRNDYLQKGFWKGGSQGRWIIQQESYILLKYRIIANPH